MERQAVAGGERLEVPVVGCDADDLHRQRADAVAVEQIVQAVAEPRYHDQQARLFGGVPDVPLHGEARGDRLESLAQIVQIALVSLRLARQTHEEASRSRSTNWALSMMFQPRSERHVETAATMPIVLGHARVMMTCRGLTLSMPERSALLSVAWKPSMNEVAIPDFPDGDKPRRRQNDYGLSAISDGMEASGQPNSSSRSRAAASSST